MLLPDVCLSVTYIGPKSRTERPRKIKIGTEVARVTRDSDTTFKVKRSKVNLLLMSSIANMPEQHRHLANNCEDIVDLQGRGHTVSPRAQLVVMWVTN